MAKNKNNTENKPAIKKIIDAIPSASCWCVNNFCIKMNPAYIIIIKLINTDSTDMSLKGLDEKLIIESSDKLISFRMVYLLLPANLGGHS